MTLLNTNAPPPPRLRSAPPLCPSVFLDLLRTSSLGSDYFTDGVDDFVTSVLNNACSTDAPASLLWSTFEPFPPPPPPSSATSPFHLFQDLTRPSDSTSTPYDRRSPVKWKLVIGSLLVLKKAGKMSYQLSPSHAPQPLSTLLSTSTSCIPFTPESEKRDVLRLLGAAEEVWLAGIVYGGETGIILKGCHCLKTYYGANLDMERAERIVRGLEVEEDWIEVDPRSQDQVSSSATVAAHSALNLLQTHVLSIRTFNDFSTSFSSVSPPPVAFAVEIFLRVWAQMDPPISILLEHIEKAPKLGVAAFCRCLLDNKNGKSKSLAEVCNVTDEVLLLVAGKCVGVNGAVV